MIKVDLGLDSGAHGAHPVSVALVARLSGDALGTSLLLSKLAHDRTLIVSCPQTLIARAMRIIANQLIDARRCLGRDIPQASIVCIARQIGLARRLQLSVSSGATTGPLLQLEKLPRG